jgi:hypothetical protein
MCKLNNYYSIRETLKTGDIVFFRGKRLLAKSIQWVDDAFYNHCGIVVKFQDRLFIIDSWSSGVNMLPLSKRAVGDYEEKISVVSPNINAQEGLDWLFDQVENNNGYDKMMLLNFLIKRKLGIKNKLGSSEKHICSELVQMYLERCGLFITEEILTPQSIYDYFRMELKK